MFAADACRRAAVLADFLAASRILRLSAHQHGRLLLQIIAILWNVQALREAGRAGGSGQLGEGDRTVTDGLQMVGDHVALAEQGKFHGLADAHDDSERLLCTSAPLSPICAGLGFSSEASLRRMFKGCTALTPQQYRQRYAHH